MNRYNAGMNAFAVQCLETSAQDRVLEIGFGGGVNLRKLIASAAFVSGVDRSPDVVAWARDKYAAAVAAGRAEFCEGRADALPYVAASFNKVCTVNTVYFWHALEAGFADIRRVLAPGGRAVIGFLPKQYMDAMGYPADIFTTRTTEDVIAALLAVGFRDIRVERPTPDTRWNVLVAERLPA